MKALLLQNKSPIPLLLLAASIAISGCHTPPASPPSTALRSQTPPDLRLFDGKSLQGWSVVDQSEVTVENGAIVIEIGLGLSGIAWTNTAMLPKSNYEISLKARRLMGPDFFCGLTFPVNDSHCSLILGGWGGSLTGLSSIDGQDASENETTGFRKFDDGVWHQIRLRVTGSRIQAWVDGDRIVNVAIEGKEISLRPGGIERYLPLGICTWRTRGEIKDVELISLN